MRRFLATTLAAAITLLLAIPLASCKAKHQLKHDTVDTFKVFEKFPYAIALYDIDNDGDLDCLTVTRMELTMEPLSATYILSLRSVTDNNRKNYTYYLRPGPTLDTNVVVIDNDYDHPGLDRFIYTDYEECIVVEFPMHDHQECSLWVASGVNLNPPQACIDQFEDNCDDGVLIYDEDSCGDLLV